MHDSPGSVVTQLCSGLQLYSAERRIADCILADVKWASVATSAELAKASHSSEATVTRLCHKLGYANYRKFQLELARDVLEQQETEARKRPPNDPLHQALLDLQNNRQEEVQATIQALNLVQLRKVLSILRAAEIIEIEANGSSLPVAMDASLKLGSLGKLLHGFLGEVQLNMKLFHSFLQILQLFFCNLTEFFLCQGLERDDCIQSS